MRVLDVHADVQIERDPEVVRRQFGDVSHHERTAPHRGVRFEVIDDDLERCRYRQITRLGPVRVRQELVLERTEDGPLVNTVVAGQFAGGTISFDVQPASSDAGRSVVRASLFTELRGVRALLALLLRRNVARAFSRALDEDKDDLERGSYDQGDPETQT